ncbi:hypothetical protein A0256_10645 [Mucilaginibacter sp. PAMC 26640]|nr:hypothetical protein A0256_10645 [Mucilaginibacter sp. PAMC 26640]
MIVKTVLLENDFLTYLLYSASKNVKSKANRRRSWLVISAAFFILGFLFRDQNGFYAYYFAIAGIISLIFYPFYQRYAYKKHYTKFLADKIQYRVGKECIINFGNELIKTKDDVVESVIRSSEVAQINEIGTHYFIRLKGGDAIIVPKQTTDIRSFIIDLLGIFQNPEIEVTTELDWRWK